MAAVKFKTGTLVLAAIVASLIDVLMLISRVVRVADYSLTLLCGLLIGVIVIECGPLWATATYAVSAALGLLLAGNECALLFLVFFGYYPVLKPLLERLTKGIAWLLKLAAFNAVIVLSYALVEQLVLPDWSAIGGSPLWQIALLLIGANAVFVLYDLLFGRVMAWYMARLHPTVGRIRKGR